MKQGNYKISVYPTESGIVDPQENQEFTIIQNEHNHVRARYVDRRHWRRADQHAGKKQIDFQNICLHHSRSIQWCQHGIGGHGGPLNGDDKSVLQAAGA